MSRFRAAKYAGLTVYTPGEQPRDRRYVKLNTNESPFPPCPEAVRAAAEEAERLQLYSDPTGKALKDALAERYGVEPENVFLANGSDDILSFAFQLFGEKGVSYADVTYGFYPVFADLHGTSARVIPLREDYTLDIPAFRAAPGMAVIANPNAPTGIEAPQEELISLIESDPDRVVLIDEAYVDFGAVSCVPLIRRYDNLLVVQTFSKARSMAGARLGFALADAGLIEDLETIRCCTNPYNVNRMTMAAAVAALKNDEYNMGHCAVVAQTRGKVAAALREMGFFVADSRANFLFARPPRGGGKALYLALKERGVLVRFLAGERTQDFVRVTIGSEEEMDIFLRETRSVLKEMEA